MNAYYYNFQKLGASKRIWNCERHRRNKCQARLHSSLSLSPLTILGELGTHNHDPYVSPRKKGPKKESTTELPAGESSQSMIDSTGSQIIDGSLTLI